MRTDSVNLSGLCINAAKEEITKLYGTEYSKVRQYHTSSKGAQEAHEAIRPTYMDQTNIEGTAQERKLYDLIWKRTAASQMADAEIEKTTVEIAMGSQSAYQFIATGEVVKFDGFLRVYSDQNGDILLENEDNENLSTLPVMKVGDTLSREQIVATQRFSQRPVRYNEASLVRKLEELGIGRPSTYATTITTIQQREYVEKGDKPGEEREYQTLTLKGDKLTQTSHTTIVGQERGKLLPTDTGIVVNDYLIENFPEIMDYNFTANVEKEFDQVAAGNTNWTEMIRHFYNEFDPQVEKTLHAKSEHHVGERILGTDPATGKTVSVRIGRFGPMVQIGNSAEDNNKPRFSTLKRTQSIQTITLEEALDLFKLPRSIGEYEEKEILINEGKFGPYIRHDGKFISIPKEEDPLGISLERAIELIEEKRQSDAAKHLKTFDEDAALQILQGRWGPYIVYKEKNYRIPKPKQSKIDELSYEDCMKIVESEDKKTPEQKAAAKAAARRAATGRAAAKKKK
jgi:DNA topoisomerase-1